MQEQDAENVTAAPQRTCRRAAPRLAVFSQLSLQIPRRPLSLPAGALTFAPLYWARTFGPEGERQGRPSPSPASPSLPSSLQAGAAQLPGHITTLRRSPEPGPGPGREMECRVKVPGRNCGPVGQHGAAIHLTPPQRAGGRERLRLRTRRRTGGCNTANCVQVCMRSWDSPAARGRKSHCGGRTHPHDSSASRLATLGRVW